MASRQHPTSFIKGINVNALRKSYGNSSTESSTNSTNSSRFGQNLSIISINSFDKTCPYSLKLTNNTNNISHIRKPLMMKYSVEFNSGKRWRRKMFKEMTQADLPGRFLTEYEQELLDSYKTKAINKDSKINSRNRLLSKHSTLSKKEIEVIRMKSLDKYKRIIKIKPIEPIQPYEDTLTFTVSKISFGTKNRIFNKRRLM